MSMPILLSTSVSFVSFISESPTIARDSEQICSHTMSGWRNYGRFGIGDSSDMHIWHQKVFGNGLKPCGAALS